MNTEEYTVEVTSTPKDQAFTRQCLDAGFDLIIISMFRTSLEKLVESEREACAKVGREAAESTFYDVGGTVEAAIRARVQEL